VKFTIDETGKIKKVFERVIEEHYEKLKILKFVYVWRDTEKMDDGQVVHAEVFKLSNKDRDLWGYDVRVEVDENNWVKLDREHKERLAWHELYHIELEYEVDKESKEETEDVRIDSEDRICFHCKTHDLIIRRFKKELKKFGLSEDEEEVLDFLKRIDKKFKNRKED